ncbi:carboxymuconolactone decarboxylase family protein [Celeribacter neptunius]|uniref:4-carboxymuconolactone decarboxylase n=1 Tax=Celeribacter neptunius TaxID=588602 RepID=A0A1I3J6F9_9RHOB|nr:carboxymuconolactone decarboxylase family protein [Celeribacter neptunius]SFI55769.1 4-carboxymuconolactone decarboxylase [Celeribacter neptunius]
MSTALEKGRAWVAEMNPTLEQVLSERYDDLVPEMAETLIEWAYGRHYTRGGVDMKTRQLCTIAALTALGGQTTPQLKINIEHTLAAGASEREIVEIIWQMAVYGGMPAAINGLNAAKEVFQAA